MIRLQSNDTLLFQGDSITHGNRIQSETDMNHIMGHGYQSILASRIGFENIDTRPRIENRGVSGDTVSRLLARWEADCLSIKPTLLSILIGTNDNNGFLKGWGPDVAMFEKTYRLLLDYTLEQLPSCKIILCEPFRFFHPEAEDDKELWDKDTTAINRCKEYAAVVKKLSDEYKTIFVPFREVLSSYMTETPEKHIVWDGTHPTFVGHQILAEQWYHVVEENLR